MIFETARLTIRRLNLGDKDAFMEMQLNPNVMLYTGGVESEEKNIASLKDCISKYEIPEEPFFVWAIIEKSSSNLIGTAALIHSKPNDIEIGIRFLEKYWGNGFGMEICPALIRHAEKTFSFEKIVAWVDSRNKGSFKILDRSILDFQYIFYNKEDKCVDYYYAKRKESMINDEL